MILLEELDDIEGLRGLSTPHLTQLARTAQLQECSEGAVLFSEGQDSPFLYIVLSGQIGLEVNEPGGITVKVSTAGPGELLGWSPLLGRRSMTATARAETRCRLAFLAAEQILELSEGDPAFGLAFLRQIALTLSRRLSSTRRQLARVLSHRSVHAVLPEGSD